MKFRVYIFHLLSLASLVVLTITAFGELNNFQNQNKSVPRQWEKYDPELAIKIRSQSELIEYIRAEIVKENAMTDQAKMKVAYDVVINRFTHSEGATHSIFSNWISWGLGFFHPLLRSIWQVDTLLRYGSSAVCSQSSYVLLQTALNLGIRGRHVGLDGHVVMEAWYDNNWHMFDPDMEVFAETPEGRILSVEELAINLALLKEVYSREKEAAIPILASRENNSYISYPPGAQFEWKSEVLTYIERFFEVFKWIVPLCALVLGLIGVVKTKSVTS